MRSTTIALGTLMLAFLAGNAVAQQPSAQRGRGQLFISPMGEPFRASRKPGAAQALWFAGADSDGDGRLTSAEFQHDAMRFFAVLDRHHDGEIDPDDIAEYENVLVPEIRVRGGGRAAQSRHAGGDGERGDGGRGAGERRGGSSSAPGIRLGDGGSREKARGATNAEPIGAARFGMFDLPEPVIAADANFNRGVDRIEFAKAATQRFDALDRNHDGAITRRELPRAGADSWRNGADMPEPPPVPPGS